MKTKKILKYVLSASILVVAWFSFSQIPALAQTCASFSSDGSFSLGLGGAPCTPGGGGGSGWMPVNPGGMPGGTVMGIVRNIMNWLLAIFAIFGIIGFVLSGIWYLLSAGEESMAEKGKEGMKWSIIGVIIGLSGFIIIQAVDAMLGGVDTAF